MDGKHKVQILDFKVIPFTSKKTGQREEMRLAQCVVTSEFEVEGRREEKTVVGELMMPRHLNDIGKGTYLAEFELSVDRDLRIGSRLASLHPFGSSANKPLVAPKAKEAA